MVIANFEHESHANFNVKINVTVKQPKARIGGQKSNDRITAVGHCYRIFDGCTRQSSLYSARFVQLLNLVENSILFIERGKIEQRNYLLDCHACRLNAFHCDHTEIVTMQMEWMVRIVFVAFVNQNQFD